MKSTLLFVAILGFLSAGYAQVPGGLESLAGTSFPVYFSPGHEARAVSMSRRIESAMHYHEELLGFRPGISLLVLGESDWTANTPYAVVYGMPHYVEEEGKLILAAEDNEFWQSFFPPAGSLPPGLQEAVRAAYSTADGRLSAQPFFDLLAIHELGHAFHLQAHLDMRRKWMGEFFCNLFLHAYIAQREPDQLPALTVFPSMVVNSGTEGLLHTSLADLQARYNELATEMPRNYGWYQCRLHFASALLYDRDGPAVCRNLWEALRSPGLAGTDEELAATLRERNASGVADVILNWERDMVR